MPLVHASRGSTRCTGMYAAKLSRRIAEKCRSSAGVAPCTSFGALYQPSKVAPKPR